MSNQSFTTSRRHFLKGAAYTSALSLGGLSGVAFAMNNEANTLKTAVATDDKPIANDIVLGIGVMQQQMLETDSVTLFNQTDEAMMLDARQPVTIERVNESLLVRPNIASANASCGLVMLAPRQRIAFDIHTTSSHYRSAGIQNASNFESEYLHITSDHSSFNQQIPVSGADALVA